MGPPQSVQRILRRHKPELISMSAKQVTHGVYSSGAAAALASSHGLPDVSELLRDLNEGRKHQSYGDVDAPELSAEETAAAIETYVESVAALVAQAVKGP